MENIISREISEKYNVVPLDEKNNILNILSLKKDDEIKNYLEYLTDRNVNLIEGNSYEIEAKRKEIYKNRYLFHIERDAEEIESNFKYNRDMKTSPVISIVNNIISYAIDQNASDIHFEGKESTFNVRMRIDGTLVNVISLDKKYQQNIISRIKVMCNLDYTVRNIPQDSRMTFPFQNRKIDIRVATIPTVYGEKIVLRILDRHYFEHTKKGIGLEGKNLEKVNLLLNSQAV